MKRYPGLGPGVCAGIAIKHDMPVTLVRLLMAFSTFFFVLPLFAYLVLWYALEATNERPE